MAEELKSPIPGNEIICKHQFFLPEGRGKNSFRLNLSGKERTEIVRAT